MIAQKGWVWSIYYDTVNYDAIDHSLMGNVELLINIVENEAYKIQYIIALISSCITIRKQNNYKMQNEFLNKNDD